MNTCKSKTELVEVSAKAHIFKVKMGQVILDNENTSPFRPEIHNFYSWFLYLFSFSKAFVFVSAKIHAKLTIGILRSEKFGHKKRPCNCTEWLCSSRAKHFLKFITFNTTRISFWEVLCAMSHLELWTELKCRDTDTSYWSSPNIWAVF